VQIMSMDDTTYAPDEPALYTLEFGTDGSIIEFEPAAPTSQ